MRPEEVMDPDDLTLAIREEISEHKRLERKQSQRIRELELLLESKRIAYDNCLSESIQRAQALEARVQELEGELSREMSAFTGEAERADRLQAEVERLKANYDGLMQQFKDNVATYDREHISLTEVVPLAFGMTKSIEALQQENRDQRAAMDGLVVALEECMPWVNVSDDLGKQVWNKGHAALAAARVVQEKG